MSKGCIQKKTLANVQTLSKKEGGRSRADDLNELYYFLDLCDLKGLKGLKGLKDLNGLKVLKGLKWIKRCKRNKE